MRYKVGETMFDQSQLMRGTLEGCILKVIAAETTYGYEIMEKLLRYGFDDIREGTIYPLLVRLEKKEPSHFRGQTFSSGTKQKILFNYSKRKRNAEFFCSVLEKRF